MTAEQCNWPLECNHIADVAVSGNEFDTLSLQLTSHFVSVQRVKLAAHDHSVARRAAPVQSQLEKYIPIETIKSQEMTNHSLTFPV